MATLIPPPPRIVEPPSALRLARELAGLSEQDLASQLRVSASHVSKIELRRELSWPRLRRDASRILGIPECDLFPEPSPEERATAAVQELVDAVAAMAEGEPAGT